MLLESGNTLDLNFGVPPLFEPDLVVTVKDESINDAQTMLEVAQHLSQVIPFIELPDIVAPKEQPLLAGVIVALNVMARYGMLGEPAEVQATEAWVDAFTQMKVTLQADTGEVYDEVNGDVILGNPLNAVLWLIKTLNKRGHKLQAGQIISLGSLRKLHGMLA